MLTWAVRLPEARAKREASDCASVLDYGEIHLAFNPPIYSVHVRLADWLVADDFHAKYKQFRW